MLNDIKSDWRQLRKSPPGTRFQNHAQSLRQKGLRLRIVYIVAGVFCILAGIVMLAIPGPGIIFIVLGISLIAGGNKKISRTFDKAEMFIRHQLSKWKEDWRSGHRFWIILIGICFILLAVAFFALSYYFII